LRNTGLAASMASISKADGVAEGSLFTYVKTKDDLINARRDWSYMEAAGARGAIVDTAQSQFKFGIVNRAR
jgi:hypothetical protein